MDHIFNYIKFNFKNLFLELGVIILLTTFILFSIANKLFQIPILTSDYFLYVPIISFLVLIVTKLWDG